MIVYAYMAEYDRISQIVTSLIFTPAVNEFHFQGPFLTLGQNIGLLVGAMFWGLGSDVWGRRYGILYSE